MQFNIFIWLNVIFKTYFVRVETKPRNFSKKTNDLRKFTLVHLATQLQISQYTGKYFYVAKSNIENLLFKVETKSRNFLKENHSFVIINFCQSGDTA